MHSQTEQTLEVLRRETNVGDVERVLRIALGTYLSWLGYTKMKGSLLGRMVAFWGIDLAIAGISGWCWSYAVLGISSVSGAANNPYERIVQRLLRRAIERPSELRRVA